MVEKTIAILVVCVVTLVSVYYTISNVGHSISGNPGAPGSPSLKAELKENMNHLIPK